MTTVEEQRPATTYTSEEFVDGAGAVLMELSSWRVCVLHLGARDEWVLPKGRRKCGETRAAAAVREACEETGFCCRLLDVTLTTGAPPALKVDATAPDGTRAYTGSAEPFMLTLRHLGVGGVKLTWWYVAAVDEDAEHGEPEAGFDRVLCRPEDALERLTRPQDRLVLGRAVELVGVERASIAARLIDV